MPLKLLLDENMSQIIADQVKLHRPTLLIESVHTWQNGFFEGHLDRNLLQAANAAGLTLVTYDQKTIPPLLAEIYTAGEGHAGIVFIDDQTIPNNDFGTLTRALILLWERFGEENWRDRIGFLEKPSR